MNINNSKINKNLGFTLIELMVATTIFSIIMIIAIGSLITTLGIAKNYRALNFAMDNVNFAMESMTRSIRMGTNYYCVKDGDSITMVNNPDAFKDCEINESATERGTFIAFIPQNYTNGNRVGYKLAKKSDGINYTIERCDGNTCVSIVSSDVNIEKLNFIVKGSDPDDGVQASVYILIRGNIVIKGVKNSFAIQTMASQRNF